jgi:hypothetical protein
MVHKQEIYDANNKKYIGEITSSPVPNLYISDLPDQVTEDMLWQEAQDHISLKKEVMEQSKRLTGSFLYRNLLGQTIRDQVS